MPDPVSVDLSVAVLRPARSRRLRLAVCETAIGRRRKLTEELKIATKQARAPRPERGMGIAAQADHEPYESGVE